MRDYPVSFGQAALAGDGRTRLLIRNAGKAPDHWRFGPRASAQQLTPDAHNVKALRGESKGLADQLRTRPSPSALDTYSDVTPRERSNLT